MNWLRKKFWLIAVAFLPTVLTVGCVQPWVADRMQENLQHNNDHRAAIMPPIRDGYPVPICEDPPSDQEVLRALPKRVRGVPYFYEEWRDNITIVKNRIVDKIDPPRFYPLIGMAQLHHCHWECAVYFDELVMSSYPYPMHIKKPRVQVVYIDKDHLHLYVGPNADVQRSTLLEMTKY